MSRLTIGRTVGALFLAAFLCYGLGGLLVESVIGADDAGQALAEHSFRVRVGGLLMLTNSVVVVAIGVLVYDVLRPHDRRVARVYLVARGFEASVLSLGVVSVLLLAPRASGPGTGSAFTSDAALRGVLVAANDLTFHVAMLGLCVGSVLFCASIGRHRLVPAWLAWWGVLGYAVFGVGAALEILGVPVGVALATPGGLFEVALGAVLLRRGFPETATSCEDRPARVDPPIAFEARD